MANKILFLDIDGVLNSSAYHRAHPEHSWPEDGIDPAALARLNRILDVTKAKIVVSSSWRSRTIKATREYLGFTGLSPKIIGITPRIPYGSSRGDEIAHWFARLEAKHGFNRMPRFVVLDDDDDIDPYRDQWVECDHRVGLQDAQVEQAIALLTA